MSCRSRGSESVGWSRVEWSPPTFRCNSSQRAVPSIYSDAAVGGWCFANALSWRPQSVGEAQTSLLRAGIIIPAAPWAQTESRPARRRLPYVAAYPAQLRQRTAAAELQLYG